MSIRTYGPIHRWFAWFPVWTEFGYKWLTPVARRRVYASGEQSGWSVSYWQYDCLDRAKRTIQS